MCLLEVANRKCSHPPLLASPPSSPPPSSPPSSDDPPSSPPSSSSSEDEPLPQQPIQTALSGLVDWNDIHQGLPETDPEVVVRVNYKVPGYFSNMNAANHGDRLRGLVLGTSSGHGGGGGGGGGGLGRAASGSPSRLGASTYGNPRV